MWITGSWKKCVCVVCVCGGGVLNIILEKNLKENITNILAYMKYRKKSKILEGNTLNFISTSLSSPFLPHFKKMGTGVWFSAATAQLLGFQFQRYWPNYTFLVSCDGRFTLTAGSLVQRQNLTGLWRRGLSNRINIKRPIRWRWVVEFSFPVSVRSSRDVIVSDRGGKTKQLSRSLLFILVFCVCAQPGTVMVEWGELSLIHVQERYPNNLDILHSHQCS